MDLCEVIGGAAMAGLLLFFLVFFHNNIIEIIEVIMNKKITITVLWIANLILFMTLVWLGEWAMHCGVTWIKNPLHISLASCTITKIFLTGLMFIAWWGNKND